MNSDALNITITDDAINHIKTVMARHPNGVGFKLTMKKYGCNGYGYLPEVISEISENDIELSLTPQFRFFVDSKYIEYLDNTEIDYVVKNLGQEQLVFRNPNVEGECGCGESVNFREDTHD